MRFIPVDQPQPDELETVEQLENWARWCRGRWEQGTCGSIEKNYRSPWWQWHPPRILETQSDPKEAVQVQVVLHKLPQSHRDALVLRYYERRIDEVICRRIAIHPKDYGRFMRDARLMLRNLLARRNFLHSLKSKVILPVVHNSIPPTIGVAGPPGWEAQVCPETV